MASALDAWAAATTPAQACAAVSTDFATHLGNGDASACAKDITSTLGGLETGKVTILKTTITGDTAIANAIIAPAVGTYTDFYFVQDNGAWKLNSIGMPAPAGPGGGSPPAP